MANKNLTNAKRAKNDEFYTQYSDIQKEIEKDIKELYGTRSAFVHGSFFEQIAKESPGASNNLPIPDFNLLYKHKEYVRVALVAYLNLAKIVNSSSIDNAKSVMDALEKSIIDVKLRGILIFETKVDKFNLLINRVLLMKRKIISLGVIVTGMIIAVGVLFMQGGGTFVKADGFGFEENILHRKSADAESVLGCMASCKEMLAGWQEMNPDSPNYTRQGEKIEAKAQQCLAMNELAGFPFSQEKILASCGLTALHCIEISLEQIHSGACGDISFIKEASLPQCCSLEGVPSGDLLCGTEGEWVVGVAASPTCYIPGS